MRYLPLFLLLVFFIKTSAQQPVLVADQTFKVTGEHEYVYAFAEGDRIELNIELLTGRQIKTVSFVRFPDVPVFQSYALDTALRVELKAPATGVYLLKLEESGLGKKVCRFTLHRTPASEGTARFDTRVGWDIRQFPEFRVVQQPVQTGVRTEMVSLSGKTTVGSTKMGLGKAVNSWQFTLPPHTVRWAYRVAVGQEAAEARRKDAEKFTRALNTAAAKTLGIQPETALAAFALGMAIDLTTSTAGEDVEYALLNAENQQHFLKGEEYKAPVWQGGVSVDVQRRYAPLEGTWFFAFKNNNWIHEIDVSVDIEAVLELPVYVEEVSLQPLR